MSCTPNYDPAGKLTGWTRIRDDSTQQFTPDGLLITKTDAQGQPVEARRVRYVAEPRPNGLALVVQEQTDEVVKLD